MTRAATKLEATSELTPAAVVRDAIVTKTKKRRDLNLEVVEAVIDHAFNRLRESFIATYPLARLLDLARLESGK